MRTRVLAGSKTRREPLTWVFFWALAAAGMAPACSSVRDDEALAMLDVSAAADVPAFATLCLSVTARTEIPTFEVTAPSTRRQKVGYYVPGPNGSVQVRAQAVASSGAVVGEGVAAVDVTLGRVSPLVSLTVSGASTSPSLCRKSDAGGDRPSDAGADGSADGAADRPADAGSDKPSDGAAADARADAATDASPTSDASDASDASPRDGDTADKADSGADRVDSGGGCTGCTPGETKTESAPCSPCSSGRWSRTVTCSATCTWVPGAWGACSDQGSGEHKCSVVDWCTRAAAPECRQVACSPEQALAECRAEAKEICGQSSASPSISYCN
jgi:hypothetical protein